MEVDAAMCWDMLRYAAVHSSEGLKADWSKPHLWDIETLVQRSLPPGGRGTRPLLCRPRPSRGGPGSLSYPFSNLPSYWTPAWGPGRANCLVPRRHSANASSLVQGPGDAAWTCRDAQRPPTPLLALPLPFLLLVPEPFLHLSPSLSLFLTKWSCSVVSDLLQPHGL